MTGALLRTGNLKAFEPLGALGNPVYLAAAQLRAAIGRRLGEDAADALAIPHRNQDGDTIDWYASKPGPVVPWSAATPEERAQANGQLRGIQEQIESLGRAMKSEETGERQTFGRLLEHVTSFPGDDHLYLVDGRPVISFWGFRQQNAPVGVSPLLIPEVPEQSEPIEKGRSPYWWLLLPLLLLLALLAVWLLRGCEEPPALPDREQQAAPPPDAPAANLDETVAPKEPSVDEAVGTDRERPDPILREGERTIIERDGAVIEQDTVSDTDVVVDPVAGKVLEEMRSEAESLGLAEEEAGEAEIPGSEPRSGETPDSGTPEPAASEQPQEPDALDQAGGDQTPKQDERAGTDSSDDGSEPESGAARSGDPTQSLKFPPGAISAGATQLLNGGWRTSTSLQDPRTALPVDMEYRLQDGTGDLKLRRSDGSVCSGPVKAVIEAGKLVVHNAQDIRCPDGTNFGRPRLECIPGEDGRAECSGRYETGEVFSVDIKKSD